jgi:hypothetical protein
MEIDCTILLFEKNRDFLRPEEAMHNLVSDCISQVDRHEYKEAGNLYIHNGENPYG